MCSCIWLTPPRLAFSSYLRGRPSTNYYIWFNKVVVVVIVVVVVAVAVAFVVVVVVAVVVVVVVLLWSVGNRINVVSLYLLIWTRAERQS